MSASQDGIQSYKDLFNSVEDAILIQDTDGTFLDVNEGAVKLYGYSKEELLGKNALFIGDEEYNDLEKTGRYFEQAVEGESQKFEWWARNKEGDLIPTEVILNSGTYFGQRVVYAIARDITDRKKTEKRITALKEFYEGILEELPTELAIFNTEAEYIYINPAAISDPEIRDEMLGRTSAEYAELKGRNPEPYRQRTKWIKNVISHKEPDSIVEHLKDNEGREHFIQRWIYPILDDHGEVKRALGYGVDITDLKQTTTKLKESLQEKDILLQEIHHRVKNNLAIVTGLMQLQLFKYENEHPKVESILRDSTSRIHSMGVIHDQLYQSGNLTQVDFAPYIESLAEQIKDTFWSGHRSLQLDIHCDSISLNINQAVPCGLLINEILTNAFKHAFYDQHENPRISIDIRQENGEITLKISDNGVGLPEEVSTTDTESLGIQMINTLGNQLEADINLQDQQGVEFEITFEQKQTSGSSTSLTNLYQ